MRRHRGVAPARHSLLKRHHVQRTAVTPQPCGQPPCSTGGRKSGLHRLPEQLVFQRLLLQTLIQQAGLVLADALMRELGLVDTPSGLLALAPIPAADGPPGLAADAILLDGVQDPGNVGTLLRTAAAAGVRQALLSPGCAAAWSPKVLRAGQGAHFVLAIHEEADLEAFADAYRGTLAVTTLEDSLSLYAAEWQSPLAWVFGAEGQGVRRALLDKAGLKIRIPMPGAVESLNVGAAAAVCLFEAVRRRLG